MDSKAGKENPWRGWTFRDSGGPTLILPAEAPEPDPDERREYWQATGLGGRALEAELDRLEAALEVGRKGTGEVGAGDVR